MWGSLWRVITMVAVIALLRPVFAQQSTKTTVHGPTPSVDRSASADWPLHNHDLSSSRYSPATEITAANASSVTLKWTFKPEAVAGPMGRNTIFQQTPLVVDGVMYVHSGSRLFAVDAATGARIWSFEMPPFEGEVRQRGPAYGDGRIYAHGPTVVYALDARTGVLVESFGQRGLLNIVGAALHFKDPDRYPATFNAMHLG